MPYRWRWLMLLAATAAFAVGFAYTLASLAPSPPSPDSARPATDERPAADLACSEADYAMTFVGVHAGEVAIFAGTPGGCSRLVATTGISVDELSGFQRLHLTQGIVFHGDDELFQILEGLTAP